VSRPAPWLGRRLHFVGVGGAGMSGLALVARDLGASVSGSDKSEGRFLPRLRERGIEVTVGHAAANVPDGAEVVYSSATDEANPERGLGLPELRRGELLGELTRLRRCIAVAGTHGKSTTTAMAAHALRGAGYLVGGDLRDTGTNADWGAGGWLVVETDESDRTFLAVDADIAVVTNVELEHHREYSSREELDAAFRDFLAAAPQAVVWDRPELLALRHGPVVAYDAFPTLAPGGSRFEWRGHEVRVRIPGEHNARNAAAALEACRLAGADPAEAAAALASFSGVVRRFERVGDTGSGALVIDDYAHHPTEVRATLEAARTLEPQRLVAVLQVHQYTRVRHMAGEFAAALGSADLAVVLDVYSTRGTSADHPGVSSEQIADAAPGALWIPEMDDAERYLANELRPGDVCVTLGSGNVDELARRLVSA
jgi:UDP-N-acetylmuramate--alanine ligase